MIQEENLIDSKVPTPEQIADSEIMQLVEKHIIKKRTKSAFSEDDVASALSGNSIVGKKDTSSDELESKMLLFNGLYFRGNWKQPFQKLRSDPEDVFFNSTSQKTRITMMRTRGTFRTGFISSIDSQAIEVPYENERYALLIVMPKNHDGIRGVIKQFTPSSLKEINEQLSEEYIHLSLPKFRVETTGRAEKSFSKVKMPSRSLSMEVGPVPDPLS